MIGIRPPWYFLGDEFSWQGWRHEGARRILPPRRIARRWSWRCWLHRPGTAEPEFVLIESAWENFRRLPERFSRPLELARALQREGIPVVFWNKEDPVHFERFLPIALASDVVLTTDADCLPRYREAGFRGPLEVMTFPVQPAIHRQYLPKDPDRSLFFAGTWRPHHEERQAGFHDLVLPALEYGLEIFARGGDWPEQCRPHVVGTLPYLDLLVRSSAYAIGLSVSSVKNSPTMFPRRVVEMAMADVLVLSDRCRALTERFPEIPQTDGPRHTRELIAYYLRNAAERREINAAVRQRILRESTYERQYFRLRELALASRNR